MSDLEELRSRQREHEEQAAQLHRQASEHGLEATRISRLIADLPCDEPRTRDELIIHLGWHHKKRPPLGVRKQMLVAIHDKLIGGGSDGSI